jgi:CRP/FNR family transcriptional regulator, cyclic AMP receptor protein
VPIVTPVVAVKKHSKFDTKTFLSTINSGRLIATFAKKQSIFAQGDFSDAVFYIQRGRVTLTVVSKTGKEATIGILNEGDFFGEGCLTWQRLRMCSATAMTDCSLMKIDKKSMVEVLHREHSFSDLFVAYLLTRNIRYEEDLVDQLFNSSEKRLARILLLLAQFGKEGKPETSNPQNESGDPRRDDRHNPRAGQFFHEQVQKVRFRRVLTAGVACRFMVHSQRRSPRLELDLRHACQNLLILDGDVSYATNTVGQLLEPDSRDRAPVQSGLSSLPIAIFAVAAALAASDAIKRSICCFS